MGQITGEKARRVTVGVGLKKRFFFFFHIQHKNDGGFDRFTIYYVTFEAGCVLS
jgi:hypothetical protein